MNYLLSSRFFFVSIYGDSGVAMSGKEVLMDATEHLCRPYQQAIELIGKRWTGVIIMVLLDGPRRFNEIAERLEGASDRMLSERLKELEATAILERHVYPET